MRSLLVGTIHGVATVAAWSGLALLAMSGLCFKFVDDRNA